MIGNRLSAVLLAAVVVLGVLAGWLVHVESRGDAPLAASPAPAPVALATDPSPSRPIPSLDELSQTLERPLFVRGRRPPQVDDVVIAAVPADVPQEPVSMAMSIELSAVVLESERQYALFRQTAQDRLLKVEVGQEVEGWVVREIRADSVRLERGTQSQDLLLRTFKPAAAPSAPVRAKARRRARAAGPSVPPATTKRRPRRPLRGSRQRPVVRQ